MKDFKTPIIYLLILIIMMLLVVLKRVDDRNSELENIIKFNKENKEKAPTITGRWLGLCKPWTELVNPLWWRSTAN